MKLVAFDNDFYKPFFLSIFATLIFISIGFSILSNGHLHEDAYILFIYAENLAKNGVPSFYQEGPPAEGATDFLWMIVISIFNFLGIDSGSATTILNGLGIFFIAYISTKTSLKISSSFFIPFLITLALPFTNLATASYAGFSTALYSSLVLLIFQICYLGSGASLLYIPVIGLLLGLFRPDGVIIGIFATITAFLYCESKLRNKFIFISVLSAFFGLTYFLWRWRYFGEILPLPLYVKSEGNRLLAGYDANLNWVRFDQILILTSVLYFGLWSKNKIRFIAAFLPVLALLFALFFAVQSQNVNYRFQAPVFVVLYFTSAMFFAHAYNFSEKIPKKVKWGLAMPLVFLILIWFSHGSSFIIRQRHITNDDYINYFPFHAREVFQNNTVFALTEAGRAAYWLPGKKYDLVGLNTAYTARNGADLGYIKEINPDIIFVHVAGTINHQCDTRNFCFVDKQKFSEIIAESDYENYEKYKERVVRAPLAVFSYLLETEVDYKILFARDGNKFSHLWALKKASNVEIKEFSDAISLSFSADGRLSYKEMKKQIRAAQD